MTYPIVIPLHHTGGKLRDNTELRYSLRSLAKHFKSPYEIAIVGKKLPDWAQGIEHIPSNAGLKTALRDAAARFPDGFFWWYDDCCLLNDITGEGMQITPCVPNFNRAKTKWARNLNNIKDRLEKDGHKAWDYSRPHGPYWFDKAMVDESFVDWPVMKSKFPFESWILSKRDWPRRHGAVKQYYGPFRHAPGAGMQYLNYNDQGNSPDLRAWLNKTFPEPSPWEKASIDGDASSWFFIHVPKTGGKSILAAQPGLAVESVLRHKEWKEAATKSAWRSAGALPILAVVRHPVDRAISTYYYFRARKDFFEGDEPQVVLGEMCRHLSLSEFWEKVDIPKMATAVKHLRTQHSFIEGAPCLHLMRFESLDADYCAVFGVAAPPLPHLNASPRMGVQELSPAAEIRIRQIYEEDFTNYYPGD